MILCMAVSGLHAAKSPGRQIGNRKSLESAAVGATSGVLDRRTSASRIVRDQISSISEEIRKADSKPESSARNVALLFDITGEMRERGDTLIGLARRQKSLKDYLDLMRKACDDKDVRTVVVRLSATELGLAKAQELRGAISEFRNRGKKTIAIFDDDSQPAYLVACACDEVVMPPSGDLMLTGVAADAYFLRGLLTKLGVEAQVLSVGKYKSFGEMFTEDDYTTPARENMSEIVEDVYSQLVEVIATSRKMTPNQAEAIVNSGPRSPTEALQSRLIDRIAYADDVYESLEKEGFTLADGSDYFKRGRVKLEDVNLFSLLSLINKPSLTDDKTVKYPQVAVVYAVGSIVLGSGSGIGLADDEEIASNDFIETLDEIATDKKIKAVILRVDSPGGSAFASDLIWKKIDALKRIKPVVATMGDVAASGGYYIAMAANKVIAHEGTITGSIGVVGGKINLGGGYNKLGISKSTVSRGAFANLYSETTNFSPDERKLVETMMRRTYDDFVAKAAESRKMKREDIDRIAQGRIWTGRLAKKEGLVDEIGGLARAVTETKNLLGLKKDDRVSLVTYPKELTVFDLLQKAFGGAASIRLSAGVVAEASVAEVLPPDTARVLSFARKVARLFIRERILAVMPCLPVIR